MSLADKTCNTSSIILVRSKSNAQHISSFEAVDFNLWDIRCTAPLIFSNVGERIKAREMRVRVRPRAQTCQHGDTRFGTRC